MLVIRFQKLGKKNQKVFRLVLQEKSWKLQGKAIKVLGRYNPYTKESVFDKESILFYLKNGAQISDSAFNILVKKGVLPGPKRRIHISGKSITIDQPKESQQEESQMNQSIKDQSAEKQETTA